MKLGVLGFCITTALVSGICFRDSLMKENVLLSWTKYLERNYDERIRRYSHPAKVFERFASVV